MFEAATKLSHWATIRFQASHDNLKMEKANVVNIGWDNKLTPELQDGCWKRIMSEFIEVKEEAMHLIWLPKNCLHPQPKFLPETK